ncbi:hypothetical protein Esti_005799 [Eimeria stiedai]
MCKPKSSRLDLRNGFYQIRMAKQEIFKTSFSSPVGFFEWTVMPMGLINAPAYFFQRFMSDLLKDLRLVQLAHRSPAISRDGEVLLTFCFPFLFHCGSPPPLHKQYNAILLDASMYLSPHEHQFLSRTFSKPETNYLVIDKEWLAVYDLLFTTMQTKGPSLKGKHLRRYLLVEHYVRQ